MAQAENWRKEFKKEKVESRLYNNGKEVIREALRLVHLRDQNAEALREKVTQGYRQVQLTCRTLADTGVNFDAYVLLTQVTAAHE